MQVIVLTCFVIVFSNTQHLPSSAHKIEAISERLIQIGKKYSQHEQNFHTSKFYHNIAIVSFCLQDLLVFNPLVPDVH